MRPFGKPKAKPWELMLKMDNIIPLCRVVSQPPAAITEMSILEAALSRPWKWRPSDLDRDGSLESSELPGKLWSKRAAEEMNRLPPVSRRSPLQSLPTNLQIFRTPNPLSRSSLRRRTSPRQCLSLPRSAASPSSPASPSSVPPRPNKTFSMSPDPKGSRKQI